MQANSAELQQQLGDQQNSVQLNREHATHHVTSIYIYDIALTRPPQAEEMHAEMAQLSSELAVAVERQKQLEAESEDLRTSCAIETKAKQCCRPFS